MDRGFDRKVGPSGIAHSVRYTFNKINALQSGQHIIIFLAIFFHKFIGIYISLFFKYFIKLSNVILFLLFVIICLKY